MFFREKRNNSGSISIQVIQKLDGKNKVVKTIGCSKDTNEIKLLKQEALNFINTYAGQQILNLETNNSVKPTSKQIEESIDSIKLIGPNLILGKIFDQIGFNEITDALFKQLVISRIVAPKSKLATTRYFDDILSQPVDISKIYRYMDKLYNNQKAKVENISYEHSKKILGGKIKAVFYDITTIHFEIEKEDELRKTGFSKSGKHQNPQILLGLIVSENAYPLAYDIFEGNKFEGDTFIPIINSFKAKYKIASLTVVADSGLLSAKNIQELMNNNDQFILGARIKNENKAIKDRILELQLSDGESKIIEKDDLKLIINYSTQRAKKDKHNRQRGLSRLEKQIKRGKLTKANINKRGYNKYLKIENQIEVAIDYDKFETDDKWDGLKGYLTNTKQSIEQTLNNYNHLWQIEKAFRVSKTDLKIRPIYHRLKRRIEAHICINFVAYKIYKELERQLKLKKSKITVDRAIEIMKSILGIILKNNNEIIVFKKNDEQKYLLNLFEI